MKHPETQAKCVVPKIDYAPRKPENYNPPIGLIGAGGITGSHLSAYRALGLNVVAIATGLIGRVNSVNCVCHWDHLWIKDSPGFAEMHHVILYDFAIHWFDIVTCFLGGERPRKVYATAQIFEGQSYQPPSMAAVIIEYANAQVCMQFHGHVTQGQEDSTIINGTQGTLRSRGPGLNDQTRIELCLEGGVSVVPLEGSWSDSGFQGTMAELLCAISEEREPSNSAASNLVALETCFAAMRSADSGEAVTL